MSNEYKFLLMVKFVFIIELESDEDDGDHEKKALQSLGKKNNGMDEDANNKKETDEDDSDLDDLDDEDDDEFDKNMLENFNSCIDDNDEVDEFIIFRNTLQSSF